MLIIGLLLAEYQVLFPRPETLGSVPVTTYLGLRANQTSPGNWTITIVCGRYEAPGVRLTVVDPSTGESTVSKLVSNLVPAKNNPDAVFNDHTGNSKLDAGDTIILKGSGGHIIAGYKVRFFEGNDIIGTIRELPAEVG